MFYLKNFRDTAGQERFFSFTSGFFRDVAGVMFVYDVTCGESFKNLDKWFKIVKTVSSYFYQQSDLALNQIVWFNSFFYERQLYFSNFEHTFKCSRMIAHVCIMIWVQRAKFFYTLLCIVIVLF